MWANDVVWDACQKRTGGPKYYRNKFSSSVVRIGKRCEFRTVRERRLPPKRSFMDDNGAPRELKICGMDAGARTFLPTYDLDGVSHFLGRDSHCLGHKAIGSVMCRKALHQSMCAGLNPR